MPTFSEAKNHAVLSVGGYPSLAPGQTRNQRLAEIVNQAGQYLYSRPWRFRERTSTLLSLVANQNYVTLPSGVEELISVVSTELIGSPIEMVTPDHMEQLRSLGVASTGQGVTHAVLSRPSTADGQAIASNRLDIYPTPTTSTANALSVRYRTGWTSIADNAADSWEIPIPKYCDALFIAYCRAFAQAYEDEGLSARLSEVDAGPLLATAATKDGILQRDLGRIRPSRSPSSSGWIGGSYGYVQNPT
jgi:hypothetical protein